MTPLLIKFPSWIQPREIDTLSPYPIIQSYSSRSGGNSTHLVTPFNTYQFSPRGYILGQGRHTYILLFYLDNKAFGLSSFRTAVMSDISGYALRRNGSCLSTEMDCGQTTPPFHACCPGNTFCPGSQYNVICCPSNANCSDIIGKNCADSKADLYSSTSDVANEGFCCARGKYAFTLESKGVGCADSLADLQYGMTQVAAISSASGTY